jgi:hypothetical protein
VCRFKHGGEADTPQLPPPYMVPNEAFMAHHPNQCNTSKRRNRRNHTTSKDTSRKTININHREMKNEGRRRKIIMMPSTSVQFFLFHILYFQLICKFVCV